MKYKSVSAYTMWTYTSRFLFLLIIPVLQQIFLKPAGIKEILFTMWPSILMISAIILFSFLEYRSIKYAENKDLLIVKKGILLKRKFIVPVKNINAVTQRYTILTALFKSKRVNFCVKEEYKKRNNSIDLILINYDIKNIIDLKKEKIIFKTGPLKVLLMSVAWSNPLISLLIAIPFINRTVKILGEEITKKLYFTMDSMLKLVKIGIPPLIASISYLILGAFFVTIVVHFFKYADFQTKITDEFIVITYGLVNEDKKIIRKNKINAIVIKQSLIMILLRFYNAYAYVFGMPNSKREYNLLFTALKKDEIIKALELLNNNISKKAEVLKPHKNRLINFLLLPIISFFVLITFIIVFIGEEWYERVIILTLFLIIIFILWWMTIRYFAYKKSRILISENILCINSFKTMSLYYAVIPIGKIQSITIKRNPLFKLSNLCKIQVNIFSGKKNKFTCKYLDYDEVISFINKNVSIIP